MEELLAKYGAGGRGGSRFQTPERSATPQYRREFFRDEDVRNIKNSEPRARPILSENTKRPSPIRHDNDQEASWLKCSPLAASKSPASRSMGESKAYSMAMKALQDRVKQLETENERLMGLRTSRAGEEDLVYLRTKEGGNGTAWIVELREKTAALKSASEEVRRAKEQITRLQAEQHHFRLAQSRLEEQHSAQKAQIAQLRKELESRSQPSSIISQPSSFSSKRDSFSRRNRLEEDSGRYVATEGDLLESTRTAYFGDLGESKEQRLEQELEAYDQQYKALLQRSQTPGADIIGLRAELNAIAGAMETKKGELGAGRRLFTTKSFDYT